MSALRKEDALPVIVEIFIHDLFFLLHHDCTLRAYSSLLTRVLVRGVV